MKQLVLLRHGESISNRDGCFSGRNDVALTPRSEQEAEQARRLLREAGYKLDMCFTPELQRATEMLRIVLRAMGVDESAVPRSAFV